MKKRIGILAALLTVFAAFPVAAITTDRSKTSGDYEIGGDLQVSGNDVADSAGTTRLSLGATNTVTGNAAVTGNATVAGNLTVGGTAYFTIQQSTAPSSSNPAVAVTPRGIGDFVLNWTDKEVCFSTGTSRLQWVKLSTPTAACGH